jgi:hypothetical protein
MTQMRRCLTGALILVPSETRLGGKPFAHDYFWFLRWYFHTSLVVDNLKPWVDARPID